MRLSIALHALVVTLVAAVYAPLLHAAPVSVSPVVAEVVSIGFAVVAVGGAVLLLFGALGAFRYVREAMGAGSVASPAVSAQDAYLAALASRLETENAVAAHRASGDLSPTYRAATLEESASWDRVNERHDIAASLRSEAESAGSDMSLYDKYLADDATHEEALRWSNKESNAEIKMPVLGPGWK